jgi:hypothetical protein
VLFAEFPKLQAIDQRLITADAGDVHDIDGFHLVSLDRLNEHR